MSSEKKPSIKPTLDGPYLVNGLKNVANQKGRSKLRRRWHSVDVADRLISRFVMERTQKLGSHLRNLQDASKTSGKITWVENHYSR